MPVAVRQPIIGPSRPAEISDKDHTIMRQIDRHYLARPLLRLAPDGGMAGDPAPSR